MAQSTTIDKQTAAATLAAKADGYGFTGVRVDGMDPLAMYQTAREAVERAAAGDGPTLIEMLTYRFAPHSTYDGTPVYRTTDEEARWRAQDPIARMRAFLVNKGLWEADQEDGMRAGISAELEAFVDQLESRAGVSRDYSPRQLFARAPASLTEQLHREQQDAGEPAATLGPEEVWAVEPDPSPTGETRRLDMTEALKLTLHSAFERDPSLVILGEDVGVEGGVFRITEGMHERFGEDRVIDTPLCETGIMGTAVGMAMAGLRPIAEIEFAGFVYPRLRPAHRACGPHPVALPGPSNRAGWWPRLPVGTNLDNLEFHTDSPESFLTHAPGLVVAYPSNPYDAQGPDGVGPGQR